MPRDYEDFENREVPEGYDYAPQATTTPLEDVVTQDAAHRRIQNTDDVVGLCTECKSVHEEAWMERNVFAQSGVPPSCRFCGGVVTLIYREQIDEGLKNRLDNGRGIGWG